MARRMFFRLLAAARPLGEFVPDAELLRRFVESRDSAAFELILHRHGEAVWLACRRILRNDADAEDAFQAAFLVLVRKAGSVRGSCIGGWLHRVAVNAALKRKADRRRQPMSLDHAAAIRDRSDETADERDIAAQVQQEVARLPERYRLPVVLCDLEGHSHAEAAAILNWPIGSVSGRLSRAHVLLRARLTRRGIAAPAALFASLMAGTPSANAVRAAIAAVGGAPVAPPVSILAQGVLAAMHTAKLKLAVGIAASIGAIALVGVGTVAAWPRGETPAATAPLNLREAAAPVPALKPEPPLEGDWIPKQIRGRFVADPPTAFPEIKRGDPNKHVLDLCPHLWGENAIKIEPTDDNYRRLLKASLHQAAIEIYLQKNRIDTGSYRTIELYGQLRVLDKMRETAEQIWANEPKELIPRLKEFVILAKEWQRFTNARVEAGTDPVHCLHETRRHRLATEAALWKALHPPAAKK